MANTNSTMLLHDPKNVATFVHQYYHVLLNDPASVYNFYRDNSLVSWPSQREPVTTLQKINGMIVAKDYKHCKVKFDTIEAQASQSGGIIVVITGTWRGRNSDKSFFETFFLASQEGSYYVLNNFFKYIEEPVPLKESEFDVSYEVANVVEYVEQPSLSLTQAALVETIQVQDVEAAYMAPIEAYAPIEATPVQETAPVSESPESSNVDPTEGDNVVLALIEEVVADTPIVLEKVVDRNLETGCKPTEEVPKKFTYASMAAKDAAKSGSQLSANRVVVVAHSSSHYLDKFGPAKQKSNNENKVVNKFKAITNKNAQVDNGKTKGRDIFISNLPKGVTAEQVQNVFKCFGPIKKGGVQVKRYQDNFYYGFVEFESANSADVAIKAGHIIVGEKQVEIRRRKSFYQGYRNNNGGCNGDNGVNGGRGGLSSAIIDGAGNNGRFVSGDPNSVGGGAGYKVRSSSSDSSNDGYQVGSRSNGGGFQNHRYNNNRQQNQNQSNQAWVQSNKDQDSSSKTVVDKESDVQPKMNENGSESVAP